MKNMNEKTKKWIIVAGGLAICAVLVMVIAGRFSKPATEDALLPIQSDDGKDIVVDESNNIEKENQIIVSPMEVSEQTDDGKGAVDKGTEQTIQDDAKKPIYTEEELTNPDKKPNGEEVTAEDKSIDHDKVETPTETPTQSQPSVGLPGFDNVPNAGENQVTQGVSDGDINKQVGTMD